MHRKKKCSSVELIQDIIFEQPSQQNQMASEIGNKTTTSTEDLKTESDSDDSDIKVDNVNKKQDGKKQEKENLNKNRTFNIRTQVHLLPP